MTLKKIAELEDLWLGKEYLVYYYNQWYISKLYEDAPYDGFFFRLPDNSKVYTYFCHVYELPDTPTE